MADLIEQAAALLLPVESPVDPTDVRGKYCALIHAQLCQKKLLGLSDAEAARAVRIDPGTLRDWRSRHPKLDHDMDQAVQIATSEAATLLRGLMKGGDATAFNAIRFFLSTHSEAYRERQALEVTVDLAKTVQDIRSGLYGLGGSTPLIPTGEGGASPVAGEETASAGPLMLPEPAVPETNLAEPETAAPIPETAGPVRETAPAFPELSPSAIEANPPAPEAWGDL